MADLTALGAALGSRFDTGMRRAERMHGGDLSEVLSVELEDGRRLVAKAGPLVSREAAMLTAIAAAGAPAPAVLGVADDFLFLEYLEETHGSEAGWRALGSALRGLHEQRGETYGWPDDYAFGTVAIANATAVSWPDFWAERRLLPFLRHLPADLADRVETLCDLLNDILPAAPPPALLHGDLWTGNVLFGPGGRAWLIDPACYFGDSEVDLAMLTLFGQPGRSFWESYGPLSPGSGPRRAAYQLWPALVHLRLFGDGYRSLVSSRLDALGV